MPLTKIFKDPRSFQISFQLIFLVYGIAFLSWRVEWLHYFACIGGCTLFQYFGESYRNRQFLPWIGKKGWTSWGVSILISALSLCLILRTNHWSTSLLAAFLVVISKYIFRIGHKHIFNPSAFGLVMTTWVFREGWRCSSR